MKARHSLIDDLTPRESSYRGHGGYPILFTNPEIRKMLTLAGAGPNDTFFDLGCGWGQNLKIALTEFDVKKAIGIEHNETRASKAKSRLKRIGNTRGKWEIINGSYEELIDGNMEEANLKDATIVLFSIQSWSTFADEFSEVLRKGCKLLYHYDALVPEIMPQRRDYPFYVAIAPFVKTISELDWLRSIVFWHGSTLYKNGRPSSEELWDELKHDIRMSSTDIEFVKDYRRRLHTVGKRAKRTSKKA